MIPRSRQQRAADVDYACAMPAPLRSLRAVVLLAGSVRSTHLRKASGRSLLDLPVLSNRSVLDDWVLQLVQASATFGLGRLPVRVMLDRGAALPATPKVGTGVKLNIEQDPFDLRGTGGLLSDLARDYGDDEFILVANAAQVLIEPVHKVIEALAGLQADVSIACLQDGSPSDFFLVRCGSMRSVNTVGYVDFKEQALPQIAKQHDVRVARRAQHVGLPIRTRDGYLDALRAYHQRSGNPAGAPPAEDWQQAFVLVEDGAEVHASAVIHDSVVLAGGAVQAGAVVVRSVVCAGGVVAAAAQVVDQVIDNSAGSGS